MRRGARVGASAIAALLAVIVAAVGCGGPQSDPMLVGEEPTATAPPPPPPDAAPPPRERELTVPRAEVDAVLAAGPGRFLATFEVRARLVEGKFAGWEMVRAPWPTLDLQAGDVVKRVNQRALERPLELESLWAELRTADAVVIEAERAGEPLTLRLVLLSGP